MQAGRILISAVASLVVAACVNTRSPTPIQTVQGRDTKLTCKQLEIEYKTNTEIAASKISRNDSDDGKDILLGLFIWPGLADFKNADGTEGNALLDRNVRLRELAAGKDCDMQYWPPQPERYT